MEIGQSYPDGSGITVHIEDEKSLPSYVADDPYLTDVWIGIILILMVLICVGYICTCILYHKFRRWKREGNKIHL